MNYGDDSRSLEENLRRKVLEHNVCDELASVEYQSGVSDIVQCLFYRREHSSIRSDQRLPWHYQPLDTTLGFFVYVSAISALEARIEERSAEESEESEENRLLLIGDNFQYQFHLLYTIFGVPLLYLAKEVDLVEDECKALFSSPCSKLRFTVSVDEAWNRVGA